ncbi:baseplate J/gp47 family protein [Escherichia coli]|uniref:baseplate J/gp47 family protein n=1 Tax=Escherichia coli TaxID=562 RepID=UPI0019D30C02|nr:baseplate J/gp47 family protein [Escherichia coli]MBN6398419.1 baseplate J/gp47 family protein [Escherichia coli]
MADSQFYRPGLPQLISMIRSDLLTRFEQDTLLRRMDAEVYARVQAAAVHTLYGYIDYLARNLLPDMCDEDWLYRHARIKRCPRKDAVAARGFVRWDGVEGTPVLPAGTQIQRDDQVTFITTATVTAADGLLRVPVVADEPGSAGNTDDGIAMQLVTPVSGLPSTGYADPDYVIWAKEVQGINRAWTFRHWKGIGTVGVMVATNDPEHPAPDESVINAVRDHILPLAPVAGSGLYVFGATEKVIPMTIALSKDTPQIRAAIKSELNALMFRDGVPEGRMYLSRISEVISLSAGEVAHRLIDPSSDIDLGETELPVLGEITWQAYDPVRSK